MNSCRRRGTDSTNDSRSSQCLFRRLLQSFLPVRSNHERSSLSRSSAIRLRLSRRRANLRLLHHVHRLLHLRHVARM
jgi:hypothetical protein